MDEKDSMTPDTIPQSTPVDGTVSAGRKNRRPVVIGVAAVAAVALVAGGVCGYRAYENHRVSVARQPRWLRVPVKGALPTTLPVTRTAAASKPSTSAVGSASA